MSFIISRGYAEVQILKKQVKLTLSLEPFGIFWYSAVQMLKKSKTEMDITQFHL